MTDISKSWKYIESVESDEAGIPAQAADIDLPADLLRGKNRNYRAALGKYGSYYDPVAATFYRTLPRIQKAARIVLEVEGVCQFADVCVNGVAVAHIAGEGKHYVDITRAYALGSSSNVCALKVWAPQMAGRYAGAGISGGVRLITHANALAIREGGVFVSSRIEGGKAQLGVRTELNDATGESAAARKTLTVEVTVKNMRGKKTARKVKKYKMKNAPANVCETAIKLARFYTWSPEDPYLYTATVTVRDESGNVLDEQETQFGIVSRALSPTRGLTLNGRSVKLKGAVVQPDNGILGLESTPTAEEYKLSRIKAIGYNAVRYTRCPTEAALDTLDRLGLMAEVDIFAVWGQGSFPYDGHADFAERAAADCERMVRGLRNHPSVTVYGLNDNAPETYGRGEGYEIPRRLSALVRSLDPTRPVSVNVSERVPLKSELEQAGLKSAKAEDAKSAIGLGREKDLFGKRTEDALACADIAGYAYLYPRYSSDRNRYPARLILGCASYPARAFEAMEEVEKNVNVVGEFVYCAADFLGEPIGKPTYEDEQLKLLPPHTSYCGDLDLIYNDKPQACYRRILLGDRSQSCIAVLDPEERAVAESAGHGTPQSYALWNWPHHLGKTVNIEVYSGGEVVALYRDGKLIGRKLAGKVNRHIARFSTEYYPGILEAVSYHKGRECARVQLSSVSAPRAVKLACGKKSRAAGELFFVEIDVTDKEGRTVPYASREVEVSVTGSGELYALGSADPESQTHTAATAMCPVYNGKALAVVRALSEGDGKISVKVTSDGLLSGKITLKVK
ncbi:MAG: DUF4982 domain-containing protein [Clostridiales bacterium]|nr:DUF4982 domain-containing protein [Clostridiales bacterium]